MKRLLSKFSTTSLFAFRRRQGAPSVAFDLSLRQYWMLSVLLIGIYVLLWIVNFKHVYGWNNDDWVFYGKALSVVMDWKNAFRGGWNIHQVYFFILSYLPLKIGISLPSYALPGFEAQTGQYRWYLLTAVFLHTLVLVVWAWFAENITTSRLVAFLSLLLFATSPTLIFWTPQMVSRLFGLPFTLPGIWLLCSLDSDSGSARQKVGLCFIIGSLFWLAQGIHYTSLYLILPVCVAFWGIRFWQDWRLGSFWYNLISFAVGCLWLQGILELIGFFLAGTPWEKGPTLSLFAQFNSLTLSLSVLDRLSLWSEWLTTLMGVPILLAIAAGGVMYIRRGDEPSAISRSNRLALGLSMLIAMIFLCLWNGMPFFRQISVLQPFLFLFAGVAVVHLSRWFLGQSLWRFASAVLVLVTAIGSVQWVEATRVFQAHLAFGRAVEWAYTHKSNHPLEWMTVYEVTLPFPEDLQTADPDSLLITFMPHLTWSNGRADLLAYLTDTPPLAAYPGLWGTETVRAENIVSYSPRQFHFQPVMSEARVYRVGDIQAHLRGDPLIVQSIISDSVQSPDHEAVNVFDHGRSPDGITDWVSAKTSGDHTLEIGFASPVRLGEMSVVLSSPLVNPGVSAMEVQTVTDGGVYTTVWKGDGLGEYSVITVGWQLEEVTHIKIIFRGDTGSVSIEEVVFPGFKVVAPTPSRTFPDLTLSGIESNQQGFLVTGTNITMRTVLNIDGIPLPSRYSLPDRYGTRIQAILSEGLQEHSRCFEAQLTDGIRLSNVMKFNCGQP